jgi:hypothetical protein
MIQAMLSQKLKTFLVIAVIALLAVLFTSYFFPDYGEKVKNFFVLLVKIIF